MTYTAIDFNKLLGSKHFSDGLMNNHFKLYQGYVTNVNKIIDILKTTELGTPQHVEVQRRFGWEFNGMRLHEYYFGNMDKDLDPMNPNSALANQIVNDFGSLEAWEKDFRACCAMRGIGWVILVYDPVGKRLFNTWVNEHDVGYFIGTVPLLVTDVFEHAYFTDFGVDRPAYVNAFMSSINWRIPEHRFDDTMK